MVLQVDEAAAVTWTQPDNDYVWDEKKPHHDLQGRPNKLFSVGMADGSVRFLKQSIDAETLGNLLNKHDGNVVRLP